MSRDVDDVVKTITLLFIKILKAVACSCGILLFTRIAFHPRLHSRKLWFPLIMIKDRPFIVRVRIEFQKIVESEPWIELSQFSPLDFF